MNLSSPADARNRGRFWLALSLSTVTALAVTVPLAFRAVDAGQQDDPAISGVSTPEVDTIEAEPIDDSVVIESRAVSTTSSLLTIDVRKDIDADLLIRAATPDPTPTTVDQTTSTETIPESTNADEASDTTSAEDSDQ